MEPGKRPAEYVYEFSHELMHFMMRVHNGYQGAICRLPWFEETVCEAFSLYALKHVHDGWQKFGLPADKETADSFSSLLKWSLEKRADDLPDGQPDARFPLTNPSDAEEFAYNACSDEARIARIPIRNTMYELILVCPSILYELLDYHLHINSDGITIAFDDWEQAGENAGRLFALEELQRSLFGSRGQDDAACLVK